MSGIPHFVIVGAPKCGTTSLGRYLARHPDIFLLRGEPHFFGTDIPYNSPRLSERQYRRLFRTAGRQRLLGERSTWYLYSKNAAAEIRAFNPDARILILIRNPADMLYSLHGHQYHRGRREDIGDFEQALDAEQARKQGRQIPGNIRFRECLYYSEIPRYSEQIKRYFDTFGRERVKVVVFDDLRDDPAAVYSDVLQFLDADRSFVPDFNIHNAAFPVKDTWLFRIWKKSPLRYAVRHMLPEPIYSGLRNAREKRLLRQAAAAPRAPMPARVRARLNAEFYPEVAQLSELLDRNLMHWVAPNPPGFD